VQTCSSDYPRGVRANCYGETKIRDARIALQSLYEAATEIEALKAGRTGQVKVGSISGPGEQSRTACRCTRRPRLPDGENPADSRLE
jgi:hypothetical protein